MATEPQILNLDEILADEPERKIIWQGQEHPIAGLTGETYLKFLHAQKQLNDARKKQDEEAEWRLNFAIIGILAPTLAAKHDELQRLKIQTLERVVRHVMAEFEAQAGGTEAGHAAAAGESTSPE